MATMKKENTVTLRLPKTKELQDDVFVSINNRTWLIARGQKVEVPTEVAEVLRHSEEMAEAALAYDAKVSK